MTARNCLLAPLLAACVFVAGCSGSSGGPGTPEQPRLVDLDCNISAYGPVAGPLDELQQALIEQAENIIGDNAALGAVSVDVITGVARLLDVVDALLATAEVLASEQDVQAAGEALFGTARAIQCGTASLVEAFNGTPLATIPLVQKLTEQVAGLVLVLEGPESLGAAGLQNLVARLAEIGHTLGEIALIPALDIALLPDLELAGVSELLRELLLIPSDLLFNLSDALASAGQLDGEATAANLGRTLAGLLQGLEALAPDGPVADLLASLEEGLGNGLGLLLVPLFDGLAQLLTFGGASESFASREFSGFLAGGFSGFPDGNNPLAALLGAQPVDGVQRPDLGSVLFGIPLVGDVLLPLLNAIIQPINGPLDALLAGLLGGLLNRP